MGIRINKLVRASLSKIAHPSQANSEMFRNAELARAEALRNAFLNAGPL